MKLLTILFCEVGGDPVVMKLRNELEAMQALVGGYIESFHLFDNVTLICNEDGKNLGLPFNRFACGEPIVGNFFLVGTKDDEMIGLTLQQMSLARALLEVPLDLSSTPGWSRC